MVDGFFTDAKSLRKSLVEWIRAWFYDNGEGCNAVIGISGGIDSSVAAALCVEALGKDRVIGVMMPQGTQYDIEYSHMLCGHLQIKRMIVDIGKIVTVAEYRISAALDGTLSEQTRINLPARIRMSVLYGISQSCNGRVINTSNLSESYVGYDTRYGDSVGDVSPLGQLTKTEIRMLAKELGLPDKLVNKVPADGLCGMTDEERFGFSYDVLDRYIITGEIFDEQVKEKIDSMHEKNLFKIVGMPVFRRYEF